MKIGELARRTGTTSKTVRYYEDIGLIPEPERAPNGYREYSEDSVELMSFIRDAQATGLSLTEIGSIIDLRSRGESSCEHVIGLLERHLDALDDQIDRLHQMREKLGAMTDRARNLDPGECVDPIRCQTIGHDVPAGEVSPQIHEAPASHRHH